MDHYWRVAKLPLPKFVSIIGMIIVVGAFVLMLSAVAMFAIDVCRKRSGFTKRFVVAVPIGILVFLYSIGVVIAGIHAVVH